MGQTILDEGDSVKESMSILSDQLRDYWASNNNNNSERDARRKQLGDEFIEKLGENAYDNVVHSTPVFVALEHYRNHVQKHAFKFPWLSS